MGWLRNLTKAPQIFEIEVESFLSRPNSKLASAKSMSMFCFDSRSEAFDVFEMARLRYRL
jgi:hypothetical protein